MVLRELSLTIKTGDWLFTLSGDSRPREIVVEASTRCNLECIHCFRNASSNLVLRNMDLGDFKRIVDNSVDSGVVKLVFTGWGEPTVNPHIVDMLKYAKEKNLNVVLNTNGMLIEGIVEDLVRIGVDELYVSVDAVDISLYERIRRLGDLSRVSRIIAKISELKKELRTAKPVVKAIFTITRLNVDQISRLIDYAAGVGIQEVYLSLYVHYPGGVPGIDCINEPSCVAQLRGVMDSIVLKLFNTNIRLWLPALNSYTSRQCPFAANRALFVRADGKVSPCMFLAYSWDVVIEETKRSVREYLIGDALAESLLDIWRRNSKMFFKLSFNQMPSCLDCNLRGWCSYTLSTEADCWGNTPNCSFCPYHYKFSHCPV
ncbi:MAG: radical SAM protein [Thermosphaera sp.]